jgi:hypothetical protein
MRCCGRFGKRFLRGGLGRRHLTEGTWRGQGRDSAPFATSAEDSERQERKTDQAEWEQQKHLRTAPAHRTCFGFGRGQGHTRTRHSNRAPHSRRVRSLSVNARPGRQGMRTGMNDAGSQPRSTSGRQAGHAQGRFHRCPRRPARAPPHRNVTRRSGGTMGTGPCSRSRVRTRGHGGGSRRATRGCGRGGSLHRRRLLNRWLNRRRLLRRTGCRQERQRVDVAVRISCEPDPQVHVRLRALGLAARADRADDISFVDLCPDGHADGPQVDERDRPALGGANGQAEALLRQPARERDDPARRRPDVRARRRADVHPTMLAARVRIAVEDERPQDGPVDGPAPGEGARSEHESRDQREKHRVA